MSGHVEVFRYQVTLPLILAEVNGLLNRQIVGALGVRVVCARRFSAGGGVLCRVV